MVQFVAQAFGSDGSVGEQVFDIPRVSVGETSYMVPDSITAHGGTVDVSAEFKAWLASIPDADVIAFRPEGRYWHESILLLPDKKLKVLGNGATIIAKTSGEGVAPPTDKHRHLWPRQRSHVETTGGEVTIENLYVQGPNPNAGPEKGAYVEALEGQHAFDNRMGTILTLIGCKATGTYGDLLYSAAKMLRVLSGHYSGSGRQGLAVVHGKFYGADFYLGEIGRTVIDWEPTENQVVEEAIVERATFGDCRHLLLNSGGAGQVLYSAMRDCIVGQVGMKCRVAPSPDSPVGRRRGPHIFTRNIARHAPGPLAPFRFSAVDGVVVRDNVAPCEADREKPGVSCNDCTGIDVAGNDFGDAIAELVVDGVVVA